MIRSKRVRVVAALGVASLLVAACGGDDDDAADEPATAEETADDTAEDTAEDTATETTMAEDTAEDTATETTMAEDTAEETAEDTATETTVADDTAEDTAEDTATETTMAEELPATDVPSPEEVGTPEKAEIKLGLIPIADVAPVFIGIERGIFEDYGLTVTTEFAAGGAAAIPAVISGDIDFAFGAYPSWLNAVEQGLPLLVNSEAVRSGPLFAGLYSMPDSGIESPEDMVGATVAVNTFNNIVQMAVSAQLQEVGLTLDDITLVEIPFPDQVAALELGDIDVASVVEPFGSIAANTLDANLVVDMFSGPLDPFPVAGWFITEDFAAANPTTVDAFNAAFAVATDIAANEEGALAAIVPTYTSATPEAAAALNYPNMVAGLDTDYLQIVPQYMVEQGLLGEELIVADYAYPQ
jgi:ABC-type nitrate/sulfonate/bicarbonate transport system substrate-binding protein